MNMKLGALILGGVAAYAYYKYSKMSVQEREDMVNNLKQRGKKLYEDYVPSDLKDTVDKTFNTQQGA